MTGVYVTIDNRRSYAVEKHLEPRGAQPFVQTPSGFGKAHGDLALTLLPANYNPPDSANSEAYARASSAAYKAVRQAQVQMSGPTFLGEARETLKMLRRPAESLRHLSKDWLDTLQKRKKANPKSWTKDISGAWLEHSFGWTPLLADARDAMKAWNRLFDTERYQPFTGFGSASNQNPAETFTTFLQRFASYLYWRYDSIGTSTRLVKIRGKVRAEAKTGARAQLELFGLTPSEFLPTAWELLPWSFLIDYFTNIGDIISAGVTDVSGVVWCSQADIAVYNRKIMLQLDKARVKSQIGNNAQGQPQLLFTDSSPGWVNYERRTVTRHSNFGLTVPDLVFELPGSPNQLANCAALLGQANALHRQKFH